MNCKRFSKHVMGYVHRTLSEEAMNSAQTHLDNCPRCALLVRELRETSRLVCSLERESAPPGFEERLSARLSAQREMPSGTGDTLWDQFRAAWRRLAGTPARGMPAFKPTLVGLILCVVIAGSLLVMGRVPYSEALDMDWGFIEACRYQHASFVATNPLADDSAVILRERARDLGDKL